MKRLVSIACSVFIVLSMSVPVLAEDEGKPVLVDWLYFEDEKDEAYWDRINFADRELTLEEYDPSKTAPLPPGYEPPTPEESEAQKAREEQYVKEQNEAAWENSVFYEKEQRDAMMNLVFEDNKCLEELEVPEETFDGEYEEFKNDDGSVTRIFDTGSIATKYPDGTFEGFDLWGNRYTMDVNGNQTIQLTVGYSLTSSEDSDSYVWHGKDGSTVTINEDGELTWTSKSGIVINYNSEGERAAIGFEHGEMMELRDGMFPQGDGKFEGPDGAVIEWHNGSEHLGDSCYSFRVIGEDGRSGMAKIDPNYDQRIDVEATREEKLKTNGNFRGYIYTSDTKTEISSFEGNAWEVIINNDNSDVNSVTFEDWDGGIYSEKHFKDGSFKKTYESSDGTESYKLTLDQNGLNGSYKDKDGEHTFVQTTFDDDGNITISSDDGSKIVINEEVGFTQVTAPDGSYIAVMESEGFTRVEYEDFETGTSFITENGVVIKGRCSIGDGLTVNINNDKVSIITRDGEEIEVEEHPDGSLSATLPDGTVLTKEPGGDWLKDNLPLDDSPSDVSGKPDALPPEMDEEEEEDTEDEDTEDEDEWSSDYEYDDDYDDSGDWSGPNYEQNTNPYVPDNDLETADTGYRYNFDGT